MPGAYLIVYTTADGEEREERWPSVEAFRAWARVQTAAMTYSAYRADEDGEWVVIDQGRLGPPSPGR